MTHKVFLDGDGDVYVMPRTLMRRERRPHQDDPTKVEFVWSPATTETLQMTPDQATLRAQAALCHDGEKLLQLWREGGAVLGTRASSYRLDLKSWRSIHYDVVAVFGGNAAHRYWRSEECELLLCQCLHLALSGRCEYEQYIGAVIAGDESSLHIVGRRGRKCKLPSFAPRGVSSKVVFNNLDASRLSGDPRPPVHASVQTGQAHSDSSIGKVAPCSRESQQQLHAPRLYATDFALVEQVLAESCKELLPHTGIYWTEAQKAWKAVYRGEYVRGSHSSFKRFETHAAAIINAVGAATAHHEDEVRLT